MPAREKEWATLVIPEGIRRVFSEAMYLAARINEINGNASPCPEVAHKDCLELILSDFLLANQGRLERHMESLFEREEWAAKWAALERDGFRCVLCRKSGMNEHGGIEVHHRIPKSYYGPGRPSNINDVSNLATLCRYHHDAAHSGWRYMYKDLGEQIGLQEDPCETQRLKLLGVDK